MDYNSFQLDVPNKLLKLSKTSLLNNNNKNTIKMVDLRTLGDSVFHYAVPVKKLEINGINYYQYLILIFIIFYYYLY